MHSPIPWMGGKRRLAKTILPAMPAHTCYVEPFAGGAAILFMREEPAEVEVLNDMDGELTNFYRVLKHHLEEFVRQFKWALVSRQMFEWEIKTPTEILTDIQRAARFYYLQKTCFGAKSSVRSFGTATTSPPKLNLCRMEEDLSAAHLRLASVYIEHLDWAKCVEKYDSPHTLFFMDPPYLTLAGYSTEFPGMQYLKLASWLERMQGKAILTINDHPDVRDVFGKFRYEEVDIQYTVGGSKADAPKSRELIFYNWG